MRLTRFVSSCLCLFAAASANAQSDEDDLKAIYGDASTVSIATGSQKPLRLAPAVASVITAADIKAMGATDLDQVLEAIAGLHVGRASGEYTPMWMVRGVFVNEFNTQILMLQNGVPMTTLFQGSKNQIWGGYPVQQIARIEVIRGPGSALYGADAYSGVINIITKTAADTQGTEAGFGAGSFATREAWLQHGGHLGDWELAAYVRFGSTAGSKEIIEADQQTALDKIFGTRASLAPGPLNKGYDAIDANLEFARGAWRWRSSYKRRDNLQAGVGTAPVLDTYANTASERITSDLSWAEPHWSPDWGLGAIASIMQYKQIIPYSGGVRLFPPGANLGGGVFAEGAIGAPNTAERQTRLSAYALYSGFKAHQIRVGAGHDDLNLYDTVEYKNFSITPEGSLVPTGSVGTYVGDAAFLAPHVRTIDYLYVQDEWSLAPDWTLTAGVRHDRYSDVGSTTNPRMALVWAAAQDVTLKLLYGEAFRAPSFLELYSINNPTNVGNPQLKPETNKSLDAALAWQAHSDLLIKLNLFRFEMRDIIVNVPKPIAGSNYANAGGQTGTGLELEFDWRASRDFSLQGNYSNQRNVDRATDTDAGYAPHHHAFARADWRFTSNWALNAQFNWVADRKRTLGDNRAPIADYQTLDLGLRTTSANSKWEFSGTVRNVFDADTREPSLAPGSIPNDLPLPRRSVYFQLLYKL